MVPRPEERGGTGPRTLRRNGDGPGTGASCCTGCSYAPDERGWSIHQIGTLSDGCVRPARSGMVHSTHDPRVDPAGAGMVHKKRAADPRA